MKERGRKVLALIPLDLDGYLFKGWESAKQRQVKTRLAASFADWQPPGDDDDIEIDEAELDRLVRALWTGDGGRESPPPPKL